MADESRNNQKNLKGQCPDSELLSAYFDHEAELTPEQLEHIRHCPECRAYLEVCKMIHSAVNKTADDVLSPEIPDVILTRTKHMLLNDKNELVSEEPASNMQPQSADCSGNPPDNPPLPPPERKQTPFFLRKGWILRIFIFFLFLFFFIFLLFRDGIISCRSTPQLKPKEPTKIISQKSFSSVQETSVQDSSMSQPEKAHASRNESIAEMSPDHKK